MKVAIDYYIELTLHHGLLELGPTLTSTAKSLTFFAGTIPFNQWLGSHCKSAELPLETRLSFALLARPKEVFLP